MFLRIFLATLLLCNSLQTIAQQKRFAFTESKMGSPFSIIFYYNDSAEASRIAKQSFALTDSFVAIFSDYIDSSELSKLSASAVANPLPVKVSPALWDILRQSKMAFDQSGGAFDITIGPLSRLWRKARKEKQFPGSESVMKTKQLVGFNKIIFDTLHQQVTLTQAGMHLDLGGIAQGYIAQKVMDYLATQHIQQVLVNVSGDIAVSGAPPGTDGWTVGINIPENADELLPRKLQLQYKAVTTSGDIYQFIEHDGKRYSHIIDPRSGYGVTFQRNVTVIANDCTSADWLATACSILSIKKAKKLITQFGAAMLIGENKKGNLHFYSTKNFNSNYK
ncbi:FAD:protein FMN transferase [soil metagenome]